MLRTSEQLNDLLDEFETALLEEDTDRAETLALEIAELYDDVDVEAEDLAESSLIRDSVAEEFETVSASHDHVMAGFLTQMTRVSVLTALTAMVSDPESFTEEEIRSEVKTLKIETETAENTFEAAERESEVVREQVTLPPRLVVVSTPTFGLESELELGESATAEFGLQNGGEEVATEVVVTFDTPAGISVFPDEFEVDEIPPGEEVVLEPIIEAEGDGEQAVVVRMDADETTATSVRETVTVTDESASDDQSSDDGGSDEDDDEAETDGTDEEGTPSGAADDEDSQPADDDEATDSEESTDDSDLSFESDDPAPGGGIVKTIAGIGGLGYVLSRLTDDETPAKDDSVHPADSSDSSDSLESTDSANSAGEGEEGTDADQTSDSDR